MNIVRTLILAGALTCASGAYSQTINGAVTPKPPRFSGATQATVPVKITQEWSFSYTNPNSYAIVINFDVVFTVGSNQITVGTVSGGSITVPAFGKADASLTSPPQGWIPQTAGETPITGSIAVKASRAGSIPGTWAETYSAGAVVVVEPAPRAPSQDDKQTR